MFGKNKTKSEQPITPEELSRLNDKQTANPAIRKYHVTTDSAQIVALKKRRKILGIVLGAVTAVLALLFIISMLVTKWGDLVIEIDRPAVAKGFTLSETEDFKNKTVSLSAKQALDVTNITYNWLPVDLDTSKDGEHNGENYVAYTFYLRNDGTETNNWNTQNNFAVYYGANSPDSHKDLTKCKPSDSSDYLYYADLPADTNQLYFVSKDNANPNYKRSQTFTNLTGDGLSATQSLIFKHSGKYDSQKYNNAQFSVQKTTGIYVSKYYKTANMGVPTATVTDTLDLHLSSSMYGGQSITYSLAACEPDGCVTLNTTTGVVTANNLVGGISEGTATLRYTITSQYGESSTFDCSIKVKASQGSANTVANAPIVTNLYIPAATTANEVNTDGSNVQEVYWFIQNGDEMYGAATQNAQYSLGGVYLGV